VEYATTTIAVLSYLLRFCTTVLHHAFFYDYSHHAVFYNYSHHAVFYDFALRHLRELSHPLMKDMLLAISNDDWQYGWSHLIIKRPHPKRG
jgi:hypothetical protein